MTATTNLPKVGDQITTLADLESLPLGTTLIVDGIGAYQRIIDGDWYIAGSDIGTDSAELIRSMSVLVVWLPEVDQ